MKTKLISFITTNMVLASRCLQNFYLVVHDGYFHFPSTQSLLKPPLFFPLQPNSNETLFWMLPMICPFKRPDVIFCILIPWIFCSPGTSWLYIPWTFLPIIFNDTEIFSSFFILCEHPFSMLSLNCSCISPPLFTHIFGELISPNGSNASGFYHMEIDSHLMPDILLCDEESITDKAQYPQGIHKNGRILDYAACLF